MKERGMALMGTGIAAGGNRAADAAHKAISSPFWKISPSGGPGASSSTSPQPRTSPWKN